MNPVETTRKEQSPFGRVTKSGGARGRRIKGFPRTALAALLILLALPCAASAQSALTDDADAHGGHTPNLNLSDGGNVYLKFKLSSTLPPGTPGAGVGRATVKLYLGAVKSPGAVDVYQLASNWSEKTVASSPPSLGGLLQAGVPVQSDHEGKFLVIDGTAAVRQWLGTDGSGAGGAPNHGVALVARDGARLTFDSKENSQTSHEPQLNLQMKNNAGPQGLQGPQGEPGPAGPQGPKGLNWRGAWGGTTDYVTDDAVGHEGSSWRARRANTHVAPAEGDDWTILAQKGDDVSGGTVTEVGGSGPITVTNPTTTPNISLGVVPAANGGTGLNSPGAAGSFLRSDGGAWSSGPLIAPDIPVGSGHYIQNSTSQQTATNFNIGGTGTANILDAATQFNLGGSRVLSNAGFNNLFVGAGAGAANAGVGNAFFGQNAGFKNTAGNHNSFYGLSAGFNNTTGNSNAFFGSVAGLGNTTGFENSFFGPGAGVSNMTGDENTFIGSAAGHVNTTGSRNTFVGKVAGFNTQNPIGDENTLLGAYATVSSGVSNSTAIGHRARVTQSDSLVLGSIGGVFGAPAGTNVGIGTTAPRARLDVTGGNILVGSPGQGLILKSPDGATCRRLSIDNAGSLVVAAVACP